MIEQVLERVAVCSVTGVLDDGLGAEADPSLVPLHVMGVLGALAFKVERSDEVQSVSVHIRLM